MLDFSGAIALGLNKDMELQAMRAKGVPEKDIEKVMDLTLPASVRRFFRRGVCRGHEYSKLLALWEQLGSVDKIQSDVRYYIGSDRDTVTQTVTVAITQPTHIDVSDNTFVGLFGEVCDGVFSCMGYSVHLPVLDGLYLIVASSSSFCVHPAKGSVGNSDTVLKYDLICSDKVMDCASLHLDKIITDPARPLHELYIASKYCSIDCKVIG